LPKGNTREEWRILSEVDPADMTEAQKELLRRAKKELVTKNIIVTPSIIGGSLV
jgi:chromatin segregation and condensation protein Rec8/ScpA/Scc1 (kleisin family)